MNEYYSTHKTAHLDSALLYLNRVEKRCPDYENEIAFHKVHVLVLRRQYRQALNTLKRIDGSALPFVGYKEVMENKIKAEQAGSKDKFQDQREFYKKIAAAYDKYLQREKSRVDSVLGLSDVQSIVGTQWDIFLVENYYYKSKIMHKKDLVDDLDSMQKAINGNEIYFDRLKGIVNGEIRPAISLESQKTY